ncbi:MAG: DbpA RNA binding domain-containing protein, partial [Nocardioides sp.]
LIDPAAEKPVRPPREERDRPERSGSRERRGPRSDVTMAMYRINVGKRHKVEPRQIVGAIANEGGLRRGDFGHIQIRPDFSLVELPADLSNDVFDALRQTRISGKLIELQRDNGPAPTRSKKPRHKTSY